MNNSLGSELKRQIDLADQERSFAMAPRLSYGRHRGPARKRSRRAAVAVAIYRRADRWMVPLTRRPDFLSHHAGQICLPGGQIETNESPTEAATREFIEELGVEPKILTHCGSLSSHYVYASDNLVYPVVLHIEPPTEPWNPDPAEVAQVIELPVATLLDPANRGQIQRLKQIGGGGFGFRAPAFQHAENEIWGATALILDELASALQRIGPIVA